MNADETPSAQRASWRVEFIGGPLDGRVGEMDRQPYRSQIVNLPASEFKYRILAIESNNVDGTRRIIAYPAADQAEWNPRRDEWRRRAGLA